MKEVVSMNIIQTFILFCALAITGVSEADNYSNVVINGQRLTMQELRVLQNQLGSRVNPGNYLYNAYNQCWANLTTGQNGCLGGRAGSRASASGSGEWDGRGNWSSWSDYGGGVGGTADGCIYTANWSNC